MRAVFTLDLPNRSDKGYPKDQEILELLRSFPWELVERTTARVEATDPPSDTSLHAEAANQAPPGHKYQDFAKDVLEHMPEVTAANEQDAVIFYGYFQDDKTKFVITKMVTGQVTFRLLHPEIPRLQASTVKIIRRLLAINPFGSPLEISNNRVVIYEHGHEHIIMRGRVIPDAKMETIRSNKKDFLLTVVPLILFLPVTAVLLVLDQIMNPILFGSMERLSTALLTTVIVSVLGIVHSYLDIRRNRLIAWDVTDPSD